MAASPPVAVFSWPQLDSEIQAAGNVSLGAGVHGTVYKACLKGLDVAVKVLSSDTQQGQTEFSQEVAVLGRLQHPHVLSLMGYCPEKRALIYPLMEGGSLADRLLQGHSKGPLLWQDRVRITYEVALALVWLHGQDVVHMDFNPADVLLDRSRTAKLSGVGLAGQQEGAAHTTVQQTSLIEGTVGYMASEYFKDPKSGPSADVYSLGVMMCEMLTGSGPTSSEAIVSVFEQEIADTKTMHALRPFVDSTAGWPEPHALQFAQIAVACLKPHTKKVHLHSDLLPMLRQISEDAASALAPAATGGLDASPVESFTDSLMECMECDICGDTIKNAMVTPWGTTYCKDCIVRWLAKRKTCPTTRKPLKLSQLSPNYKLRELVDRFLQVTVLNKGKPQTTINGPTGAGSTPEHISSLVASLGSSDRNVQEAAARALHNLANGVQSTKAAIVAESRALSSLVALLSSKSDTQVQRAAAGALCALSLGDQATKAAVIAVPHALNSLVALLSSNSDKQVQRAATKAVWALACADQATQAAIVAVPNALKSLVALLNNSTNTQVQEAAAGALRNLCCGDQATKAAIVAVPNALLSLVSSLSNKDREMQRSAAKALWALACGDQATKAAIVAEPNALNSLVALLNRSSATKVQVAAAGAVRNLARGDQATKAAIVAVPNVLHSLVALLNSCRITEVQQAAAGPLRSLANGGQATKAAIVALPNALNGLVALLNSSSDTQVQEAAAGAICNLARGDHTTEAAIVAVPNALRSLVALLNNSSVTKVQVAAAGALCNLAHGDQATKAAIVAVPHALSTLVTLLSTNSHTQVQQAAAEALCNLVCGDQATNAAIVAMPHALSSLVVLLSGSDRAVQTAAATALRVAGYNLICDHCEDQATRAPIVAEPTGLVTMPGVFQRAPAAIPECQPQHAIQPSATAVAGQGAAASRIIPVQDSKKSLQSCRRPAAKRSATATHELYLSSLGEDQLTVVPKAAKQARTSSSSSQQPESRIQSLVQQLSSSKMELQMEAALALHKVAQKSKENSSSIVAAGAVQPLVALLSGTSSSCQIAAADALFNLLCNDDTSHNVVIAAGGIQPLLAMLTSSGRHGQRAAVNMLRGLAWTGDGVAGVLGTAGRLAAAVGLLHSADQQESVVVVCLVASDFIVHMPQCA